MAEVRGLGPEQIKLLIAELKTADPALKRDLRRNLREAARPAVDAARRSILAMPSRHGGSLREEVARSVTLTTSLTRSGIRVAITAKPRKMPPGKESLPAHLDSAKGWNHPVYGRPEAEAESVALQQVHGKGFGHGRGWAWVKQFGKPGWFEEPIALHARDFQAAADAALAEAERRLSGI